MKTQQYNFITDLQIRGQKLNCSRKEQEDIFNQCQEYRQRRKEQIEEAKQIKLNQHRRESLKKYILGE